MAESSLTLTTEEREFLVSLLEIALKNARIEEHRTRAYIPRARASQRGTDRQSAGEARTAGRIA